jgi:negative regulator of genetic competence, sporulation and motility
MILAIKKLEHQNSHKTTNNWNTFKNVISFCKIYTVVMYTYNIFFHTTQSYPAYKYQDNIYNEHKAQS